MMVAGAIVALSISPWIRPDKPGVEKVKSRADAAGGARSEVQMATADPRRIFSFT
jgi:hypothetical protein